MAKMIPNQPLHGARSAALGRLRERLERALPDRVLVIVNASWVGRSVRGEPLRDGRADFAVLDPDRGLLLLNVVEGGLARDPHSGRWTRPGQADAIDDPFAALEPSAVGLRLLLGDLSAPTPAEPVCGYAVVMPDVIVPSRGFGPHAPSTLVIDQAGLDHIEARIDALFEHFETRAPARGNAPSRWWWRAAEELFVAPRSVRVRLRQRVTEAQEAMITLGERQIEVLGMMGRIRRATIFGPAGTGKTVLAIEKARMLARQGATVLLTCYNKALGSHLRAELEGERAITAMHFHELCWQFGGYEARGTEPPVQREARQRFFDEVLPAGLADAMARGGPRFDCVVVDEAQDFLPNWWPALDACCHDGDRSIRYLFYDDQQCLRDHRPAVPGADQALVLSTNWRNSKAIHDHLRALMPGLDSIRCVSPAGVPVEIEPTTPNLGAALRRVMMRLCGEGGVRPDDIVVLTGHAPARSRILALDQPIGPVRLTAGDEAGAVRIRSVQAFKGLEAPVVVLAELDAYGPEKRHALYYAGASRAQGHLVVLDSALLPEQLARGSGKRL
jgi:hypothetical protein